MKTAIGSLLFSAIISGCATHYGAQESPGREGADEARSRGLADHYYFAVDVDPSELDELDKHPRYQSFRRGCALDFYTLMETAPQRRRWQLRDNTLQGGHLGTYRRFISDSAFQQGKFAITSPLADDLEWFASELARSPLMPFVLIIGHTNSDGDAHYNQRLSERRAEVVHQFLIAKGVPDQRIHQFGVGETSPLAGLDGERSRSLNRRVELVTFIPSNGPQKQSRCFPAKDQFAASETNRESEQ